MKCPLASFYRSWPSGEIALKKEDCLKEECALWDTEEQSCDPTGLRHQIKSLIAQVWALTEKIPHEGQFRT